MHKDIPTFYFSGKALLFISCKSIIQNTLVMSACITGNVRCLHLHILSHNILYEWNCQLYGFLGNRWTRTWVLMDNKNFKTLFFIIELPNEGNYHFISFAFINNRKWKNNSFDIFVIRCIYSHILKNVMSSLRNVCCSEDKA